MKNVTFDPLWKTLRNKGLKKGDLQKLAQLSKATITKMGKDEPVGLDIVIRIANALQTSSINDIVELEEAPEKE